MHQNLGAVLICFLKIKCISQPFMGNVLLCFCRLLFFKINYFLKKISFRITIRVSNSLDLCLNSLQSQRSSDDVSRQTVLKGQNHEREQRIKTKTCTTKTFPSRQRINPKLMTWQIINNVRTCIFFLTIS